MRLEKELQSKVMQTAKQLGLLAFHDQDSRRNNPGFPDTVIVGHRGVLWRELKTETGRTSPEQDRWIASLRESGQDVAVWRPADWPTRILQEMQALGRLHTPRPTPTEAQVRAALSRRGKRAPLGGA